MPEVPVCQARSPHTMKLSVPNLPNPSGVRMPKFHRVHLGLHQNHDPETFVTSTARPFLVKQDRAMCHYPIATALEMRDRTRARISPAPLHLARQPECQVQDKAESLQLEWNGFIAASVDNAGLIDSGQ